MPTHTITGDELARMLPAKDTFVRVVLEDDEFHGFFRDAYVGLRHMLLFDVADAHGELILKYGEPEARLVRRREIVQVEVF